MPEDEDKVPMVTVAYAAQVHPTLTEEPFGDTKRPICEACALAAAKVGTYVFRIKHGEGKCVECGLSLTRPKAVAP
jgi:hypothetical protein